MVRKPRHGDNLLMNTVPQFGHEQTTKLLLEQLTTIDYERQSVYFFGKSAWEFGWEVICESYNSISKNKPIKRRQLDK